MPKGKGYGSKAKGGTKSSKSAGSRTAKAGHTGNPRAGKKAGSKYR